MSVIQWIRKKPRLSTLIAESGGRTVRTALADAATSLEPLRQEALDRVDAQITALESLVAVSEIKDRSEHLRALYAGGTAILDSAGPFDMEDLCQAAYSLCELVDRYERSAEAWDSRAIAVHVRALRLLSTLGSGTPEARLPVLEGLQRVLERVPA